MKFLAVLILSLSVLVSCAAPTEPEPAPESVAEEAPATPAGTRDDPFVGQGIIQEIRSEENLLVISHGAIPGFMAAMTMAFPVAAEALSEDLEAGDEVVFNVETLAEGYQIFSLEEVQTGDTEEEAESGESEQQ